MSYTINGGVGQWDKTSDLEWRLNQLVDDMNIMWSKIAALETTQDDKFEPYDKRDAGEPVNQHYIDCLKQNVRLIEENDVLRYQYEAMKNETARCKGLFDQLAIENQRLEKIIADKQKVLDGEKAAAINIEESSTYWQQRYNEQLQTTDILYKELANKQKVLEMTMDQRDAAQWYREQAIKKCIDIVEQNKNDPLTAGDGKRWMVAICEDIQQEIKKEFGVK
jgi:hypothetical protein